MFGITSASEKYQQVIQKVLKYCSGMVNISDDIIIYGPNRAENDKRLEKVLTRLKVWGPSLIKEKYIIYLPKFTFIGLVLWQRTRHWSNGRESRSIETSTWTTESTEVKSFLGLLNFNSRFIPDLTTISEPSRRLTKKEESVCFWSRAAGSLHRTLWGVLGSFDCNAETKIIADSSPVGLRTVLLQERKGENPVIAYSSWGLSDVERRRLYSQTEKEVLGIVWDCEKFHVYLYELVFWLWTDHKPLEFVYAEWSRPSARIERWFSIYGLIFFSEILAWANEHFFFIYPGASNLAELV